jgi:antitoxin ParD1/3/4/toxin ParE1/3/4
MARYLLSGSAKADIVNIISYIRQRNPSAAKRVKAKLRSAMQLLAELPGLGHLREDSADESLRFWSVYSYLIVYRTGTRPLEVVRVIHGARGLGALADRP